MKKISWFLCVGAVLIHIWILWDWNQDNLRLAKGVCCGYLSPIERVLRNQGGETGWYSFVLAQVIEMFDSPKAPLVVSSVSLVLGMLFIIPYGKGGLRAA